MDTTEAHKILAEQFDRLGSSYSELVPLVESWFVQRLEIHGPTGARYEVRFRFFWHDKPQRIVRVVGSIDDGGIRAFFPLTKTLLVSPAESTPPTEAPD